MSDTLRQLAIDIVRKADLEPEDQHGLIADIHAALEQVVEDCAKVAKECNGVDCACGETIAFALRQQVGKS